MYSSFFLILLLNIAGVAFVGADTPDICNHVAPRIKKCCNASFRKGDSDVKECYQLAKPPPSCEMEECIAKKFGVMSEDGTVDKITIGEALKEKYSLDAKTYDAVVANCINGDLSKYGKEDYCELLKIKICIELQVIENCPEWSNEGDCENSKEELLKCFS